MISLDEVVYNESFRGISEICQKWLIRNPEIYTAILEKDTEEVIGYINVMPLKKSYIDQILNGDYIDVIIPEEAICEYDEPGTYYLYLSSIVIRPDYQKTIAFKILFDAVTQKIINLSKRGIYFKEMIADAVSQEGECVSKGFGMDICGLSAHESKIYQVSLLPPRFSIKTKLTKELRDIYAIKYMK